MSENLKVRNIRNEYIYSFMWNLAVLVAIVVVATLIMPASGPIGIRTMVSLYMLDGGIMLMFMYVLEKYTVTNSGLYEKLVITILSALYTFVIMGVLNLLFFTSLSKLIADSIIAFAKIVAIFGMDFILHSIRNNEKLYQKPKLLIIDSNAKNFFRMKRIKYGVLKNYDSWYENLDGISIGELKLLAKNKFSEYDAICILDGLSDEEYHIVVSVASSMNKDLFIAPKIIDVGKTNARIARFDDVLTLYMPQNSLTRLELFLKRVMDIVLSAFGLIVAVVPMAIIALAIKLTSPGPIFYKQLRLTQNKKEFYIYKFRTMIPDAEKLSGPKFAEKDDPRITKIGKILRACRLDELPQIINILKGDMSVVGPRPERPVFVEQFEKEIEDYDYRFQVKAGLTSLSHVYGRYSTYIHDRTYYDLFYITHYSLMLDLKIILLTTKTMFLKSAAEGEDDYKEKTVVENHTEVELH